MGNIILPADAGDEAGASDGNARMQEAARAAMLAETLQLGRYSAVTQAAVVLALAGMFWNLISHAYLAGLAVAVTALCASAIVATRRYRGSLGDDGARAREAFRVLHGLALGRGLAWASMPAVLLPSLDNAHRFVVGAVCAALISHAYVAGPIFSLALLAVAPVVAGMFVGLAGCEGPVGRSVAVLLSLYAAFVFVSARRMCRHSYQRIRDRVMVQAQSETIGLLLKDFAEGTSDWLWETDKSGRLRQASAAMAVLLGLDPADLRHRTLPAILREFAEPDGGADAEAVATAIEARTSFRDRTVRLATARGTRWITLNGKPVLDEQGAFAGYRGVGSDATESREAQARIAFLAGHDPLTGLPNRGGFQATLTALCREVRSSERRSGLFYLDLDGFKAVNDNRGHLVGDRLLQEAAARLLAVGGPHGVFRLGGDEFAVVARDLGRPEAETLASRIVAELRHPFRIDEAMLEIGVSVGIAYVPDDAIEPESLLMRADLALYAAKADGKGCWRCFDPSLEERVVRQRQLDVDMRAALAADEMELHYQPLVDMRSGRVTGFEALLRWNKPGHGWISPGEIIPIAEATGFIVEIGRWALRRACTDARGWPDLRVAVNISSIHMRMPGFHEEVAAALRETGLAPGLLEIEITESVLLDHGPEVLENLRRLRATGVRIALDDFGTGYSSLSYLTEFPFDKVKVDRSFVRDLHGRPEKAAVVEAIARMARALSMNVTVEGVETVQQLDVLRDKRCDVAQGFLYSPARPVSEVAGLIRRIEGAAPPRAVEGDPTAVRPPLSLACVS
ncbi:MULTISPECIES: putative bifunctional diguanylate cyclase/phosphodiesterase [Methylobacterium]|uniref:putative bifunctional diguanylate cyclase/phosphodiesterase n=1 Tax=Methylobacterium TaxID=407 RepID=UPI0013EC6B75|nr:EAL domain-containing protein [Methylobacterium sp. DB0501]NGM34067.1 EAL domain-containing protein [Methylobacterium sp. DB0501]